MKVTIRVHVGEVGEFSSANQLMLASQVELYRIATECYTRPLATVGTSPRIRLTVPHCGCECSLASD